MVAFILFRFHSKRMLSTHNLKVLMFEYGREPMIHFFEISCFFLESSHCQQENSRNGGNHTNRPPQIFIPCASDQCNA
jgi:hypothetical protein